MLARGVGAASGAQEVWYVITLKRVSGETTRSMVCADRRYRRRDV